MTVIRYVAMIIPLLKEREFELTGSSTKRAAHDRRSSAHKQPASTVHSIYGSASVEDQDVGIGTDRESTLPAQADKIGHMPRGKCGREPPVHSSGDQLADSTK